MEDAEGGDTGAVRHDNVLLSIVIEIADDDGGGVTGGQRVAAPAGYPSPPPCFQPSNLRNGCLGLQPQLGLQAINDPQKLAGKNNHFCCVLRVSGDVAVALWIFIKADCANEEICHRFLFGGW